jgi:hypothetical protein
MSNPFEFIRVEGDSTFMKHCKGEGHRLQMFGNLWAIGKMFASVGDRTPLILSEDKHYIDSAIPDAI